jgi:hypothetical protein
MTQIGHKYKICLVDGKPAGYVGLLKGHEITYCVEKLGFKKQIYYKYKK